MPNNSELITGLFGALGAILSILGGFWAGRGKTRQEYRKEVAFEVWKVRKEEYTKLMGIMSLLSLYPSNAKQLQKKDLQAMSEAFREWYFGGGGLFLSPLSKSFYMSAQKSIDEVVTDQKVPDAILEEAYYDIRNELSKLRSSMVEDLLDQSKKIS